MTRRNQKPSPLEHLAKLTAWSLNPFTSLGSRFQADRASGVEKFASILLAVREVVISGTPELSDDNWRFVLLWKIAEKKLAADDLGTGPISRFKLSLVASGCIHNGKSQRQTCAQHIYRLGQGHLGT
jgi:hypothetical protein